MIHSTPFLILAFVLLWNSGFIGAEYALLYAGPFTFLFWRYWLLALILFAYLVLRRRLKCPGFPVVGISSLIGILAHGVWLGCVFVALQEGVPAGIVALIVALQPMMTGAFSGAVLGERTSFSQWFGLLIGFLGVIVVIWARIDMRSSGSVFGYFIPFGSVIAITVASLIQRRTETHSQNFHIPLDLNLFFQSIATAIVVTVPAIAFENLATEWQIPFVIALLWVVLGVSLGAYGIMWALLSRIEATRVASLFYLGPPVTMVMAWIAFGDTVQRADIAGLVIVAVGISLVQIK